MRGCADTGGGVGTRAQPERPTGARDVATAGNTPHHHGPPCGGKVEHNFVQIRQREEVSLAQQEGEGSATRQQQQQQQFLQPWMGSSMSTAKPQVVLRTAGAVLNVTLLSLMWLGVPRHEN